MKISETKLAGVKLIEPDIFGDERGFFLEIWNKKRYESLGIQEQFVQDNLSLSKQGVLRGLHFQYPCGQGKLVTVLWGEVFDVAVDIRVGSPSFCQWVGVKLSAKNKAQLFIPAGFAHGFCVLSEYALFAYKCSEFYNPTTEGGICWNDPQIAIAWPIKEPLLSEKDKKYPKLSQIPLQDLPFFGDVKVTR